MISAVLFFLGLLVCSNATSSPLVLLERMLENHYEEQMYHGLSLDNALEEIAGYSENQPGMMELEVIRTNTAYWCAKALEQRLFCSARFLLNFVDEPLGHLDGAVKEGTPHSCLLVIVDRVIEEDVKRLETVLSCLRKKSLAALRTVFYHIGDLANGFCTRCFIDAALTFQDRTWLLDILSTHVFGSNKFCGAAGTSIAFRPENSASTPIGYGILVTIPNSWTSFYELDELLRKNPNLLSFHDCNIDGLLVYGLISGNYDIFSRLAKGYNPAQVRDISDTDLIRDSLGKKQHIGVYRIILLLYRQFEIKFKLMSGPMLAHLKSLGNGDATPLFVRKRKYPRLFEAVALNILDHNPISHVALNCHPNSRCRVTIWNSVCRFLGYKPLIDATLIQAIVLLAPEYAPYSSIASAFANMLSIITYGDSLGCPMDIYVIIWTLLREMVYDEWMVKPYQGFC